MFLFFLQSSAANIICTNWRSETKKKNLNHNKKKNQKTKTDLKPDSQTAQRYTVTCWRVTGRAPKAKSAGIVGPLAHFTTRRHAHGALHSQKHRTAAHNVRSDNTEGHYPLHTPLFSTFWYLLRTEHL